MFQLRSGCYIPSQAHTVERMLTANLRCDMEYSSTYNTPAKSEMCKLGKIDQINTASDCQLFYINGTTSEVEAIISWRQRKKLF